MRESWVDYAKGLGIILVVLGHVNRGLYNSGIYLSEKTFHAIDTFIYNFHMPLFFFLSGLFFIYSIERRGKKDLIVNKIDTILYPYIIWSLIQGSIEILLSQYTNNKTSLFTVLSLLWEPRAQFWFLYALFMVFVFSTLIYNKKIFSNYLPYLLILFLTVNVFRDYITQSYHVGYLTKNLFFFFLGMFMQRYLMNTGILEKFKTTVMLFILFTAFQIIYIGVQNKTALDVDMENTALSVLGILFIISLSCLLSNVKLSLLQKIGEMSMVIYLMHIIAGSGIRITLSKLAHTNNWYIHAFIGISFSIFLPIIAATLIKKWNMEFLFKKPKFSKKS